METAKDKDPDELDSLDRRFENVPPDPEWEPEGQFTSLQRQTAERELDTAPPRRTGPPSPSSEDTTLPEGYVPPLVWETSPSLLRLPLQRRPPTAEPGQGVACATCPVSIWFVAPSMVRCHCPPLGVVTWETGQPQLEISLCDARERAIELALQHRQELAEGG